MDEALVNQLLATNTELQFAQIVWLNKIDKDIWEKDERVKKHFDYLISKLPSFEECSVEHIEFMRASYRGTYKLPKERKKEKE